MATGGEEIVADKEQDIDFTITYIKSLGDVIEKDDGELIVSQEHGLLFKGLIEKQISLKSLRWVSREWFLTKFPNQPEYCIVVSYLDDDSHAVGNVFFVMKTDSEGICQKCLDCMKDLLTVKYQGSTTLLEKPSDVITVVLSQPIFMGNVKMSVISAEGGDLDEAVEKSEGETVEFLMVQDLECVCLYKGGLSKPVHHLMFWEEEGVQSIERVKLTQKPGEQGKTVCLQTKTMSFAYSADPESVRQLQNLIPKKKHLMTDPSLMLEVVPKLKGPHLERAHPGNRTPVSENWEPDYVSTSRGAVGWDEDTKMTAESNIARRIEGQLANADDNFRGNEDMLNIWVAIEFDIKEIMESGTVPTTDHRSGGMDKDSGEHLEKALSDVSDHLKENNLPVAISRLKACREFFGTSSVSAIRQIFNKNDLDLLRALYFKSLTE